jgi:hypothetical protein
MSGLKSSAIVLLVAIPFGLYVAWQVQKVTTGDLLVSEAPSEKGVPGKEQLATTRAKAERWVGEVRKASAVVYQFRAPGADDTTADAECTALVRATGTRAADLSDLEKFLSRIANPQFTGKLKDRYKSWYDETEELRLAAASIEQWFDDRRPVIDSATAAGAITAQFNKLLEPYTSKNSIFMDRGLVAGWRVRVIARIVEGLSDAVRGPYKRVLELPLPLPVAEKNEDVRTATGALREMKAQVERLDRAAAQARTDGITIPEKAQSARTRALDAVKEWAAGDELLALFADPELLTDPNKAATWLPKVQEQLGYTQSAAGRAMIRKKVQEFCEAYVPKQARLDSEVLLQGIREQRSGVEITYASDAGTKPLTDLPDGLNEFNYTKQFKNFDRVEWGSKFTGTPGALKPTPKSLVARDFSLARTDVTTWSPAAVNRLKMKCEAEAAGVKQEERRALLDELVGFTPSPNAKEPDRAWTKDNTKLLTRLAALSTAMAKHPALFDADK